MTSCASHSAEALPSSPSTSTALLAVDQDSSLSAPSNAIQSSLKNINDYLQKHYERFIEHESLERSRLVASFAEKEKSYEKQISTLKAVHIDIAALLVREQSINGELRQKLDVATSTMARLCKVVADPNFIFVDRTRGPHRTKQEDSPQESVDVSDIITCPNTAISSLLSQIETIVTEINAQSGVSLPSPGDPSPRYSTIEALDKVANSLLATQRSFALLIEDFRSADAVRVDTECQNRSLQKMTALLQEELQRIRGENKRISRELTAARLQRESHICRPPASVYPTPATQDDFPVSLPSPPLEKRDLPIPDDFLQNTCKITRKTNQTPPTRTIFEDTTTPPPTPTVKAGPSPAPTPTNGERRRASTDEAVKQVTTKSPAAQGAPLEPPIVQGDRQTAGLFMPPPPTPVQGVKRTSGGVSDRQDISNVPRTSSSISALATSQTSDKTNNHRPHKKRRINGPSGTSLKNKPTNETPAINANATHPSTPTTGPPSASSSKCNGVQLPKTNASDLKSLKFNKVSQFGKSPSTPASMMSFNTSVPTRSDRSSMKPLDLAKKSPQERAALRKAK